MHSAGVLVWKGFGGDDLMRPLYRHAMARFVTLMHKITMYHNTHYLGRRKTAMIQRHPREENRQEKVSKWTSASGSSVLAVPKRAPPGVAGI